LSSLFCCQFVNELTAEDEDKQYNDELTAEDKQYNDELTAEDEDKRCQFVIVLFVFVFCCQFVIVLFVFCCQFVIV
jgi:hypothetical protein